VRFNKLVPEISVTDIEESLRFYTKILGFEVEYSRAEDRFAFLSLQGSQLMVEEINHNWDTGELERPYGRGVNLQIEVDSVEELREYRRKTKLHNMLQQVRTECYTYLDEGMWPVNKPLLREEDYEDWAPKPNFYK